MNKIVAPFSLSESHNDTIFYDIVGNFIPPEWKNFKQNRKANFITCGFTNAYIEDKAEEINSKGISLSNDLQETYYFFEKILYLS